MGRHGSPEEPATDQLPAMPYRRPPVVTRGEEPPRAPASPPVLPPRPSFTPPARGKPPVAEHDGRRGNPVRRAEPKVRAATLAAVLTSVAMHYLGQWLPVVLGLPEVALQVEVLVAGLVTGLVTFVAGFAARAVDRVDLFTKSD